MSRVTAYSVHHQSGSILWRIAILSCIAAFSSACTSINASSPIPISTDSSQQAIKQLYTNWRTAVQSADIPAYVGVLADDVRLIPPGAPDIVGAQNYAQFLGPVFATADHRIEVVSGPEVEVLGDFALARYHYIIHLDLKNPEEGVNEPGALTASRSSLKYFDVLNQDETGNWRVWRHSWTNAPDPTDAN